MKRKELRSEIDAGSFVSEVLLQRIAWHYLEKYVAIMVSKVSKLVRIVKDSTVAVPSSKMLFTRTNFNYCF